MVIYGLVDPRDPLKVKYVGKTKMSLKKRLQSHIDESRKNSGTYKKNWVRKLLSENIKPNIIILKETTEENWQQDEINLISSFPNLTNTLEGGFCGGVTVSIISQYDLNGVYIKTFESIENACQELNYERGIIGSALQRWLNKENNIGGEYLWVYELNKNPKKYIKPYLDGRLVPVRIVNIKTGERMCFESIKHGLDFLNIPRNGNLASSIKEGYPYKDTYSIVPLK